MAFLLENGPKDFLFPAYVKPLRRVVKGLGTPMAGN
jgi:hypothetical protein